MNGKNITVKQAAEIMGKDQQFIRIGLQRGILPFGTAIKSKDRNRRYSYYISPELFRQYTGVDINKMGED